MDVLYKMSLNQSEDWRCTLCTFKKLPIWVYLDQDMVAICEWWRSIFTLLPFFVWFRCHLKQILFSAADVHFPVGFRKCPFCLLIWRILLFLHTSISTACSWFASGSFLSLFWHGLVVGSVMVQQSSVVEFSFFFSHYLLNKSIIWQHDLHQDVTCFCINMENVKRRESLVLLCRWLLLYLAKITVIRASLTIKSRHYHDSLSAGQASLQYLGSIIWGFVFEVCICYLFHHLLLFQSVYWLWIGYDQFSPSISTSLHRPKGSKQVAVMIGTGKEKGPCTIPGKAMRSENPWKEHPNCLSITFLFNSSCFCNAAMHGWYIFLNWLVITCVEIQFSNFVCRKDLLLYPP